MNRCFKITDREEKQLILWEEAPRVRTLLYKGSHDQSEQTFRVQFPYTILAWWEHRPSDIFPYFRSRPLTPSPMDVLGFANIPNTILDILDLDMMLKNPSDCVSLKIKACVGDNGKSLLANRCYTPPIVFWNTVWTEYWTFANSTDADTGKYLYPDLPKTLADLETMTKHNPRLIRDYPYENYREMRHGMFKHKTPHVYDFFSDKPEIMSVEEFDPNSWKKI